MKIAAVCLYKLMANIIIVCHTFSFQVSSGIEDCEKITYFVSISRRSFSFSAYKEEGRLVSKNSLQCPWIDQSVVTDPLLLSNQHISSKPLLQFCSRYNCDDEHCYKDLARLRGLRYMTWENIDKLTQEDEVNKTEKNFLAFQTSTIIMNRSFGSSTNFFEINNVSLLYLFYSRDIIHNWEPTRNSPIMPSM